MKSEPGVTREQLALVEEMTRFYVEQQYGSAAMGPGGCVQNPFKSEIPWGGVSWRVDPAEAQRPEPEVQEEEDDPVNHPSHYTQHPSGVETIQITEHFNFNIGNVIKYCWRAGLKSADPTQDLEKARFYLNRELERITQYGN